ncbi:hypothetical protein PVE54_001072 [Salmonella enterica]|nr:hypothetical protein [Salmonella enterica]
MNKKPTWFTVGNIIECIETGNDNKLLLKVKHLGGNDGLYSYSGLGDLKSKRNEQISFLFIDGDKDNLSEIIEVYSNSNETRDLPINYKIYHEIKRIFNAEKTVYEFYQQNFSNKDYEDIGEAAALAYIEDKISSKKLEAYSELLSYMDLDKFTFAVSCLYERDHNSNIKLSLTSKQSITRAISEAVEKVIMKRTDINIDEKNQIYQKYNDNLVNCISGCYKTRGFLN